MPPVGSLLVVRRKTLLWLDLNSCKSFHLSPGTFLLFLSDSDVRGFVVFSPSHGMKGNVSPEALEILSDVL
jgi:hypothetical protein